MKSLIAIAIAAGTLTICAAAATAAPATPAGISSGERLSTGQSLVELAQYRRGWRRGWRRVRCWNVRRVHWRNGRRIVTIRRVCR